MLCQFHFHIFLNLYSQKVSVFNFRYFLATFSFFMYLSLQIVDPEYGMFTWPCAPVLAQFIWKNRSKVAGKNVLEVFALCFSILKF